MSRTRKRQSEREGEEGAEEEANAAWTAQEMMEGHRRRTGFGFFFPFLEMILMSKYGAWYRVVAFLVTRKSGGTIEAALRRGVQEGG